MTREEFITTLTEAYLLANPQPINHTWLKQILSAFLDIFDYGFDGDPLPYLKACLESLTQLTRAIDPLFHEHASPTLFSTALPPYRLIDPKGKTAYERAVFSHPSIEPALTAAEPFKEDKLFNLKIDKQRNTNWNGVYNFDYPRDSDYSHRSDFTRARIQREKDSNEWYSSLGIWRWPFMNTILFRQAEKFLPPIIHIPFEIPSQRWFEGCWIVAPQGSGKTNLLRHLVLDRIKDNATVVLMDAKGDLLQSFDRLKSIKDRLVVLEPEHVSVNPFELKHSSEMLLYLFSVFNTEASPFQTRVLDQVLRFCTYIPNATLREFRRVLQYGWERYPEAIKALEQADPENFEDRKHFFTEQWKRNAQISIQTLLPRVDMLIDHNILKHIFLHPTSFNWPDLLNSGKVICINLNENNLTKVGAEFFGRLILALTWHARRGEGNYNPVYFYLDEADVVIKNDVQVNEMIARLRSKLVSLIFAHQQLIQIESDKVKAALGNCKIKFTNAIGEAAAIAYYFGQCDPALISSLNTGQFVAHISPETRTAPVTLSVPFYDVEKPVERLIGHEYMSEADYQALPRYKRSPATPPTPEPEDY